MGLREPDGVLGCMQGEVPIAAGFLKQNIKVSSYSAGVHERNSPSRKVEVEMTWLAGCEAGPSSQNSNPDIL